MKPTKMQFLAALLSVSLPLAFVGCNRANSDTDATSKPTPPPVELAPAPDTTTNATQGMTPGSTSNPNGTPIPADSSKVNNNSTPDNSQTTAAPDESSKTNTTSPNSPQTTAAPDQSSKPSTP